MTPSEPHQDSLGTAKHVQSRARAALFNGLRSEDSKQREAILDQICKLTKNETREHYTSRARSARNRASSRAVTPPESKRGSVSTTTPEELGLPHDPSVDAASNVIDEVAHELNHIRASPSDDGDEESLEERKELLRRDMLAILRLSIDCPFSDVRKVFTQLLSKLRSLHAPTPMPIYPSPSYFISPYDTITLEWPLNLDDCHVTTPRHSPVPPPPSPSPPPPAPPSSIQSDDPYSGSSSLSSSPPFAFDDVNEHGHSHLRQLHEDCRDSIDGSHQEGGTASSSSSSNNPPNTPATPMSPPAMPIGRQPDKHTRQLMVNTFLRAGRLSHVNRILAFFPKFWERYQETYERVIKSSEGPVPKSWRCYIGIMAAAQSDCQYLVSLLSKDFLLCNGDEKWLQGLEHAPAKLRNLATLNTILAHQPWRLTADHIGALMKPSTNPAEKWNTPEIVQVIIILSTFHSLSSFVLGCGIVPEYDTMGGNVCIEQPSIDEGDIARGLGVTMQTESGSNGDQTSSEVNEGDQHDTPTEGKAASSPPPLVIRNASTAHALVTAVQGDSQLRQETERHTSQLITRLMKSKEREMQAIVEEAEIGTEHQQSSQEQVVSVFANCEEETFSSESPTAATPPPLFTFCSTNGVSSVSETLPPFPPQLPPANTAVEDIARFRDRTVEMPYEEFDVRSNDYSIFQLQEYCWEDHGVSIVNEYLPGIGQVLDDEFREVHEVTDRSSIFHSQSELDTTPLRQAIWFYAMRLSGLLKDDYDYHDINTFLNRRIKRFIKKVCCEPETIDFNDWNNVGFQLRAEEKCHVTLIASQAKKQAELVYGLWCVMATG